MSFSLPGTRLYYLLHDNLEPERYESIVGPAEAWRYITDHLEFDDLYRGYYHIDGVRHRPSKNNPHQRAAYRTKAERHLRNLVYRGEVVLLGDHTTQGKLFYINRHGELVCHLSRMFEFSGEEHIIREYQRSVRRRKGQNTDPLAVEVTPADRGRPAFSPVLTASSQATSRDPYTAPVNTMKTGYTKR